MEKFLTVNALTGMFSVWYNVGKDKWHDETLIASSEDEEWRLKENYSLPKDWLGYCSFSEDYARNIKGFYEFKDFEKACIESKKKYNKYFAPNALYRVVRYFDNVFDRYESEPMSKKKARKIANQMNSKNNSYLNDFDIKKV